jgi:hypothetical protein
MRAPPIQEVDATRAISQNTGSLRLSITSLSSLGSTESISGELPTNRVGDNIITEESVNATSRSRQDGNNTPESALPPVEESIEERIQRLGRQRPKVFDSLWAEIGFVFSICMSQVLTVSCHPLIL